ncbi:MAG: phosphate ABC transporter permease PstA, partial [Caulobacterales bacterium]|nr:phosphate ABC transporter permease PstA [Caulobacterales bacterium]
MTDATADDAGGVHEADQRRLGRRYAAELRFRSYGIIAIALAIAALAVLAGSVFIRGYSALFAHTITLDVHIDEARVDPRGVRDPEGIRRANFNALIQQSLRDTFPNVEGRRDLRSLFALYTPVNAARLMRQVVEDPSLIGQTVSFTMPISDDVDLFLKGQVTDLERQDGRGTARVTGVTGMIDIRSDADDFAVILAELKRGLAADADRFEADAALLEAAAARETDEAYAYARRQQAERTRARAADYRARSQDAGGAEKLGPDVPSVLVFINGGVARVSELSREGARAMVLAPLASGDPAAAGGWRVARLATPEADRRVKDNQIAWTHALREAGRVESRFNTAFFTNADSREPELAGVAGSFVGSLLTMLVTMLMAVPIGAASAIYLEEFAPKNWLTNAIEVNINNLAAVPSIVFGLLGLAVFINTFGLPRSAPLVGGMVLALMTLPTVIIATRSALKAVPPSIRAGALGVGASPVQTVFHHVLPLALPGILTGSIIGLAQALGETAPLLMIGMVAFVADVPGGLVSPSTVMPVQIYLWSDSAERAFESRTAAAIIVLLTMLVIMNL